MLRVAAYIFATSAMILMWFVLPGIYGNAATAPDEITGQIVAINNHGATVYITQTENLMRVAAIPLVFATVGAAALSILVKRRKQVIKE